MHQTGVQEKYDICNIVLIITDGNGFEAVVHNLIFPQTNESHESRCSQFF